MICDVGLELFQIAKTEATVADYMEITHGAILWNPSFIEAVHNRSWNRCILFWRNCIQLRCNKVRRIRCSGLILKTWDLE